MKKKMQKQGSMAGTILLLTVFLFLGGCTSQSEAAQEQDAAVAEKAGEGRTQPGENVLPEEQAQSVQSNLQAEEQKPVRQTLKILSVSYHPLIASAAVRYEELHPDMAVAYESVLGDSLGDDRTPEAAAGVYNRLHSGEAVDVLILDDLPVEKLIREGWLEDLSGALETVLADENYYQEVIGGYRTEEGLFAAVTEFTPLIACLREGVPEEVLTLEGLNRYLTEHEDRTGFVPYQQKNQLGKVFYRLYGGELFRDGEPDRKALACYLQTWKLLKDRADAAESRKLDKMAGTIDELAFLAESGYGELCFLKEVGTISSVTARRTSGIVTIPSGKNLPGTVVGVPRQTEQKEQAMDFVRFLFLQVLPQEGGVTVYKDRPALEEEALLEQEKQGDHFTVARESFVRYSLREEDIDWLFDIYGKCSGPVTGQNGVYEILKENCVDFLEGKQGLEQAEEQILKELQAAAAAD